MQLLNISGWRVDVIRPSLKQPRGIFPGAFLWFFGHHERAKTTSAGLINYWAFL